MRKKKMLKELVEEGNEVIVLTDVAVGIDATEPSILAMTTSLLTHVKEQFGEELYETVIKLSRMTEEELTNEMLKELKEFLTKGEE